MGDAVQVLTSPFRPEPLKPAFGGLGVSHGYNPRSAEKARSLVFGLWKSGKTSFICSNPRCLVIDLEGGACSVTNPRAYVCDISHGPGRMSERFTKVRDALVADSKTLKPQFTTVAIDSADYWVECLSEEFCKANQIEAVGEYKGQGAGYYVIRQVMMGELRMLEAAGYGVQLTGHLGEKSYSENGEVKTRISPRMSDSFLSALSREVDQIMTVTRLTREYHPKVTRQLTGGRTQEIEDKGQTLTETTVQLCCAPSPNDKNSGARVTVPTLVLPEADGWAVFAHAYADEVNAVKAKLAGSVAPSADAATGPTGQGVENG